MRYVPLAYAVRGEGGDENVPTVVPALAPNQPYSVEHGLIKDELISRANHTDGLFRNNNTTVYFELEEATRGTQYAATIKPCQRTCNG